MSETDQQRTYSETEQHNQSVHARYDMKRREGEFRSGLAMPLLATALATSAIGAVKGKTEAIEVGAGTAVAAVAIDAQAARQTKRNNLNAVGVALSQDRLAQTHHTWTPSWARAELSEASPKAIEIVSQRLGDNALEHSVEYTSSHPPTESQNNNV